MLVPMSFLDVQNDTLKLPCAKNHATRKKDRRNEKQRKTRSSNEKLNEKHTNSKTIRNKRNAKAFLRRLPEGCITVVTRNNGRFSCCTCHGRRYRLKTASQDTWKERLLRTLYGTRDAANAWDEFFNNAAIERGYEIGWSSLCICYHREQDSHGWRHGDDLAFQS